MRRLLVAGVAAAALWAPSSGRRAPGLASLAARSASADPAARARDVRTLLPLPPRFVRGLDNRERVVVGIDEEGKPHSVRVLQTIVLKRLGDYVLTVPAPVVSVTPGPGTESQPGRRENQILWEGFSPGRRVLAAWAELELAASVAGLPVEVKVEPGAVTIRNATGVTVPSFTAEPDPASLALVSGRVRSSIKADVFPEGLNVGLRGKKTPEQLRVAAPLRVRGTVRVGDASFPFAGLLDGVRRSEIRVPIPPGKPEVEVQVRPEDIKLPRRARSPRDIARADDRARAHVRAEAAVRPVPLQPRRDRAELGDVRLPHSRAEADRRAGGDVRRQGQHRRLDRARPRPRGGASRRRRRLGALLGASAGRRPG